MSKDMAFSNEEIGELVEFLRKEGLDPCDDAADLIEAQAAELEALRERVRDFERLLIGLHEICCTEENCVLDGGKEHQIAFQSTRRKEG